MYPTSGNGRDASIILGPLEWTNQSTGPVIQGNSLQGTKQSRCPNPVSWRRKQIQFSGI
jgi:hypothetical protein